MDCTCGRYLFPHLSVLVLGKRETLSQLTALENAGPETEVDAKWK